jgi:hypothetical protein
MTWLYLQVKKRSSAFLAVNVLVATVASGSAHAFDGCKVILCLAGPWRSIPECVPDVKEALRCMARGKCWPRCASAPGVGLSWTSAYNCPPQYLVQNEWQGTSYCAKTGVVDVAFNGVASWVRVWFNQGDDSSVSLEYSAAAKAFIGPDNVNTTFDDDYARWVATQPPPDYSWGNGGH